MILSIPIQTLIPNRKKINKLLEQGVRVIPCFLFTLFVNKKSNDNHSHLMRLHVDFKVFLNDNNDKIS